MKRVLVDTSVFIDFLRGQPARNFEQLLHSNCVLLCPYVRLELIQGVRQSETPLLMRLLGGIPQVPHRPEILGLAESLILSLKGSGLNVGLVDVLIAAQAMYVRASILSSDRVFQKLSKRGLITLA